MKRILSILAAIMLLFSLFGCAKEEYPQIEDTFANALDWGNTYAAEQGDWIAMRSQGKKGQGILLYNKKEQKSRFLVNGDYKNIGLLENKVFYCTADAQSALYYFDLSTGETKPLAANVRSYQVRDGMVYYTTTEDSALYTIHLQSGAQSSVKLSYEPERFWWTDYGLYYYAKENQRLMVLPKSAELDRFVLQSDQAILDLASIKGAQILFLCQGKEENVLCSFNPSDRQVKEHYKTAANYFAYTRARAVLLQNADLCSIDLATDQGYSWGRMEEATDVQLLSDCAVSYRDGIPTIDYYAKK